MFRRALITVVLAAATSIALVVALIPAAGAASSAGSGGAGRPGLARGSELSLSRAPAGLRAAVRGTLGVGNGSVSSDPQQAELTARHGAAGDGFGDAVAISGSTAVVGAPGKSSNTGAAYVFVRSGTAWSEQAKLTDPHGVANDDFGASVAISGSTALVGASGKNSGTGAAYAFARSGTAWSRQATLKASDGAAGNNFGASVAISSSTAVIGAPFKNSTTGAAYVFGGL
jgi:hypothetical protein